MPETPSTSRSAVGRVRVIIAWLCTVGAIVWAAAGFIDLRLVGMENNSAAFHLVAPALVIAAVIHLWLVSKGTKPKG